MRLSQCTAPDSGERAVAVDPEAKAANLRRLRRLEGQVRGLQKMVEEDRYCPEIMIQISAAREALPTVGGELMRNHLGTVALIPLERAAATGLMPCTTNWSI
jgi:CsoR family transcriptional regulator, copper-sensing transcriptional repressor